MILVSIIPANVQRKTISTPTALSLIVLAIFFPALLKVDITSPLTVFEVSTPVLIRVSETFSFISLIVDGTFTTSFPLGC
jgi:hypothetical protein